MSMAKSFIMLQSSRLLNFHIASATVPDITSLTMSSFLPFFLSLFSCKTFCLTVPFLLRFQCYAPLQGCFYVTAFRSVSALRPRLRLGTRAVTLQSYIQSLIQAIGSQTPGDICAAFLCQRLSVWVLRLQIELEWKKSRENSYIRL